MHNVGILRVLLGSAVAIPGPKEGEHAKRGRSRVILYPMARAFAAPRLMKVFHRPMSILDLVLGQPLQPESYRVFGLLGASFAGNQLLLHPSRSATQAAGSHVWNVFFGRFLTLGNDLFGAGGV